MNLSIRCGAGLLALAAAISLVGKVFTRYERQEQPRNTTPIVVFDQGYYRAENDGDPWALPGWDFGMDQHRSLATAGCHLLAYAHCIQWVTGAAQGDALLEELLTVCKNPSDQEENNHRIACQGLHDPSLYSKEAYDAYLLSRYNIHTVELEKTPEALEAFFAKGGAIVTFIPGHYISAVGMREVAGTKYVHIIDSNWGTAQRRGYEMCFIEGDDTRVRILHIADGTYTEGSDYWVTYDQFADFNWKTPILPPGMEG